MKKMSASFVKAIASLLEGMKVTLKYFCLPSVTMQYPEKRAVLPGRYRGVVRLIVDEKTGSHRCIGCSSCVRICPNYSLSMECIVDETKKRVAKKFDLALGKCMFCGLCVDVCPTHALEMDKEYELSVCRREELTRSLLP